MSSDTTTVDPPDEEEGAGATPTPTPAPAPVEQPRGLLPPWLLATVVVVALALLVGVVVVGLSRDAIDATGVATVLVTLISGTLAGALIPRRGPK